MAVIRNLDVKITADVRDLSEALTSAKTALLNASAAVVKLCNDFQISMHVHF